MTSRLELRHEFDTQYPGENWDGECAGVAYFVCRVTGTVKRAYPSATDARLASVIVSTDPAAAPASAFHHWSYRATIGGITKDWGHVAAAFGDGWALMSNPDATDEHWGIALGVTRVADWTARRRGIVTYLGWSHTYGVNTANIEGEEMLSNEDLVAIGNAVWGNKGGPTAPLIINGATGGTEYPATTLGHMQRRVRDEVIKPALDQLRKDLTGPSQIDYDKLASALARQGIAAAVADELAARLKS